MKLILLRHGATEGNLKKQYIGSTDEPLSAEGVEQAKARAKKCCEVQALWVSPMQRAVQTAEILYPKQQKRVLNDLREMDFGDCEQKTWQQIDDPAIYTGWMAGDPKACFPNGETLGAFAERTRSALVQIAAQAEQEKLSSGALVAHGGVLMMLLSQFGVPKKGYFEWSSVNCGGFVTEFDTVTLSLTVTAKIGEKKTW